MSRVTINSFKLQNQNIMEIVYTFLKEALFFSVNLFIYRTYKREVTMFKNIVGYSPNVACPEKYHEKMLWRKVFDQNPLFKVFCDKIETKEYIRIKCPNINIPKTLWLVESISEISDMPISSEMVIKGSHGSGYNYFPNGSDEDKKNITALATQWLDTEYGTDFYEPGYFGLKRKIFAEELFRSSKEGGLIDVSVRCSAGKAIMIFVVLNCKTEDMQYGHYDLDGNRLLTHADINAGYKCIPMDYKLPGNYHEIIRYAEILSSGVDFARYDFMTDGEVIYAGEITVYPAGGLTMATPVDYIGTDVIINQYWDIRDSWFLNSAQTGWKSLYAKMLKCLY